MTLPSSQRASGANRPGDVRVMMVVPQYPYPVVGGLERQAHELSKALARKGVSVRVVSGKVLPTHPDLELVEGLQVRRIPWSTQKATRFARTPFDLFYAMYRDRDEYDVVHLHQASWFSLYGIACARALGKPVITKLPSVGEQGLPGLRALPFGELRLTILQQSTALIAMSTQSLQELADLGYPRERILATPNGIRMSGEVKPAENHSNRLCRAVFVGRLTDRKGIDDLLWAWRNVVGRAKVQPELEIWGSGPLEGKFKALCRELGLGDRVRFLGHVENVRQELANVDLFVLPSHIEGNSNAILEAMAAGLPIVSTRVGGTPMQVGPAGAPHLHAPGDRIALENMLVNLIDSPEQRAALGTALRQRVETYFSIESVADTYLAAYRAICAGKSASTASSPVVEHVDSPAHSAPKPSGAELGALR